MKRRCQLILAVDVGPPAKSTRRIGWLTLNPGTSAAVQVAQPLIRESLRRAGWDEGGNLVIERLYAEGEAARLARLAHESVRLDAELIAAVADPAIAAAKRATSRIRVIE